MAPHLYVDDTQVGGSCCPSNVSTFSLSIRLFDGVSWMGSNRLQLNSSKTEILWCASSRCQHQIPTSALSVEGMMVDPVASVRDLGIFIDANLSMVTHVQRTVSQCFAVLRLLGSIRRLVPPAKFRTLVVALVLSRLDYVATGLLVGSSFNYVTLTISLIHLPVCSYKIAMLTYKVLQGTAPRYLGPLVCVSDQPGRRNLHSASTAHLLVPPFKLSTFGSRTFKVSAAQTWNSLPDDVTSSSIFRNCSIVTEATVNNLWFYQVAST
jgi:hypothetical protein